MSVVESAGTILRMVIRHGTHLLIVEVDLRTDRENGVGTNGLGRVGETNMCLRRTMRSRRVDYFN